MHPHLKEPRPQGRSLARLADAARRGTVAVTVAALGVAFAVHGASGGPGAEAGTASDVQRAARKVGSYTPVTGAIFNRPIGTKWQQYAIFRHINKSISSAPAGSTIRMAVYSFAQAGTANKLLKADKRGVNVQVLFNDHQEYGPERRLIRKLGTKTGRGSFAKFCSDSCRGVKGNMHQKVFLFSKAGSAENVVMVGSNNMTRNNAVNQWSDIYTVAGDPALYWTYAGVFDQMKQDRVQSHQFINARINSYGPEFYPNPSVVSQETDPIWQQLSQISCTGAAPGYGTPAFNPDGTPVLNPDGTQANNTMIRLSHHAWNGDRGKWLARKVAELKRAGCDVRIVYGIGIGGAVKAILSNNGIPMSSGTTGKHTHQKVLFMSGVFAGNPASQVVWNGSHNWSDGALKRDDTVLRVEGPQAFAQYNANFEDMWANG
jgi:phosphatidylserine/phosphatidylglycerophosphate/cardiolipin synthase-like enzyme